MYFVFNFLFSDLFFVFLPICLLIKCEIKKKKKGRLWKVEWLASKDIYILTPGIYEQVKIHGKGSRIKVA